MRLDVPAGREYQRATVEDIRSELRDAPSPSSVRKLLDIMIDRRLLGNARPSSTMPAGQRCCTNAPDV